MYQLGETHRFEYPDLLERGVNLRLCVVEPIQSRKNHLSQVWQCTYSSPNHQGSEESSVVILKLLQESLRVIPQESLIDYIPMEEDITHESRAYQQLRDIQGSILPYSYGFYNFTLSCGENTVGHVMEFIFGDQLNKRAKDSVHDLDELQRLECRCRDIDDLLWACLDVPELARAARTWIETHFNDPMLEGLNYEVQPFESSCHNEDDRPIIARSEKENVTPAVSNTEEVSIPHGSKEPLSGI
ncbi:hypothetical protein M422DRAFT_27524 [Sphaerobolus stellatus SS14]|nr:hypothetical protein M422DRAFT_27524 [Sphaerobolus stellatus SS14]